MPPPVIRFVSPWVFSCVTISFSRAPSRSGYKIKQSVCQISNKGKIIDLQMCNPTGTFLRYVNCNWEESLIVTHAWLQTDRCMQKFSIDIPLQTEGTYSGGVAKSALSSPAELWTDTETESLPKPPFPKLLLWKLYAACPRKVRCLFRGVLF